MAKEVKSSDRDLSIEERLVSLYSLQKIDSQIDKIRIVRGELPLEVEDLEDEIAGLETRLSKYQDDIVQIEGTIEEKKAAIIQSKEMIKKYEEQQMNVRNNREYDSLSKEIEFQGLEIQLSEKRIKENTTELDAKKVAIDDYSKLLDERKGDLDVKKSELTEIVKETEKDEEGLIKKSEKFAGDIEDRLLSAYKRIRKNARNGLAVVKVERDACGGCFNKIPPQRQLDIRMHKKIIVCEYCGRILIDSELDEMVTEQLNLTDK